MIERSGGDMTIHTHREFASIARVLVALHVLGRSVCVACGGGSPAGKELGDQCCALASVLARILIRNEFEKHLHSAIAHETGDLPRHIVPKRATTRIRRLASNLT